MMKKSILYLLISSALLIISCSTRELLDDRYQNVGESILRANNFLRIQHIAGYPDVITSDQYKDVLRQKAPSFAPAIEPYYINVVTKKDHIVVRVSDAGKVFLIQPSCIIDSIYCWVYKGECDSTIQKDPCQ